jgi:hypothetical protein
MFRNQAPNLLVWHEAFPEEIVKMI